MAQSEKKQPFSLTNRKALYEYEILEKIEAGIVLQGTEVKSLRAGKLNFKDSYARFKNGEAWVYNLHIGAYDHGSSWNHDPLRPRKLLLHKREINRLMGKSEERGLTLVPIRLYFKQGRAKLELALARGKKVHDKRKDIAARDARRDAERDLKQRFRIKL
ncbi:SsrA-binding protein SmpB [candidate division KSB1 bacterium]|nr:SsrA-binding protein SmpB [candidate division KSB1 bacterium]